MYRPSLSNLSSSAKRPLGNSVNFQESVAGDSEAASAMPAAQAARVGDGTMNDTAFPKAPPPHGVGLGVAAFNRLQQTVPLAVMLDPSLRLESSAPAIAGFDPQQLEEEVILCLDMSGSMGFVRGGGADAVCAAEATAQFLEQFPEYCKTAFGARTGRLHIVGFGQAAGYADKPGLWMPSSATNGGRTVQESMRWAKDAAGEADEILKRCARIDACKDLCTEWAAHMRSIVFPDNNTNSMPKGMDGMTAGTTNIGAAVTFSSQMAATLCKKNKSYARIIIATDGHANTGLTRAEEWRQVAQDRHLSAFDDPFPASFSALMMGADTDVQQLSLLANKKGLLGYAQAAADIPTGLDSLFASVKETMRGAFDVVFIASYEKKAAPTGAAEVAAAVEAMDTADGEDAVVVKPEATEAADPADPAEWVECAESRQLTYLNSGFIFGENYECLSDAKAPKMTSELKDADELRLKVKAFMAPSLLARLVSEDGAYPSDATALLATLEDDLKLEAFVQTVPVLDENARNYFKRFEYTQLAPTPSSLRLDAELQQTDPSSLYDFVKRNLSIEETAFIKMQKARTHEEMAEVSRGLERMATAQGSQRLAARFRGSARRAETITRTIAEGGEEAATYRSLSAAHSAAAAYSQTVAEEE